MVKKNFFTDQKGHFWGLPSVTLSILNQIQKTRRISSDLVEIYQDARWPKKVFFTHF